MSEEKYLDTSNDPRELRMFSFAEVGKKLNPNPALLIAFVEFSQPSEDGHPLITAVVNDARRYLGDKIEENPWIQHGDVLDNWGTSIACVLDKNYNNPESHYALTKELMTALRDDKTVTDDVKTGRILDCMVVKLPGHQTSISILDAVAEAGKFQRDAKERLVTSMGRIGAVETVDGGELTQHGEASHSTDELAEVLHKLHTAVRESIVAELTKDYEWGDFQEDYALRRTQNIPAVVEAISGMKQGSLARHIDANAWVQDAKAAYQGFSLKVRGEDNS